MNKNIGIWLSVVVLSTSFSALAQQIQVTGPLTIDANEAWDPVPTGHDGYHFQKNDSDPDKFLRITNNATLDISGYFFNDSYIYIDEGASLITQELQSNTDSFVQVDGALFVNDSIYYGAPYKWSSWMISGLNVSETGYVYSRYGLGNWDANTNWHIEGIVDTDRIGISCANSNNCQVNIDGGTVIVRAPTDPDTNGYWYDVQNGGAEFSIDNNGSMYVGYSWTDTNGDGAVTEDELTDTGATLGYWNNRKDAWGYTYTDTATTSINDGKMKISSIFYNGIDDAGDSKAGYVNIGDGQGGQGILEVSDYSQTNADSITEIYSDGELYANSIDVWGGEFNIHNGGYIETENLNFNSSNAKISGNINTGTNFSLSNSQIDIYETSNVTAHQFHILSNGILNIHNGAEISGNVLEVSAGENNGTVNIYGNANINIYNSSYGTTNVYGSLNISNSFYISDSNLTINFNSTTDYGNILTENLFVSNNSNLHLNAEGIIKFNPENEVVLIESNNATNIDNLTTTWSSQFDQLTLYDAIIGLSDDGTDVVLNFNKKANADQAAIRFDGIAVASRSFQTASMKTINSRINSMRLAQQKNEEYQFAGLASDAPFNLRETEPNSVWLQTFGMSGQYDGDTQQGLAAYDTNFSGVTLGYDHKILNTRLGLAIHYATGNIEGTSSAFDVDSQNYQVSLYSSTDFKVLYFNALLGYGQGDYNQKRYDMGNTHTADYASSQYSIALQVGKEFKVGEWSLSPYVGLDYSQMTIDEYTESTGLLVEEQKQDLIQSKLGGVLQYQSLLEDGDIFAPYLTLEVGYDAGDKAAVQLLDGNGLLAVSYNSVDLGEVLGRIGAGFSFLAKEGWQWGMEYEYESRNNYESHMGMLKGRLFF